ncbi:MAG: GDSL-type esterase/lipase family protein [Lachnospiraceae bacterium]
MTQEEQVRLDKLKKAKNFRKLNKSALQGQIVCAGSSLMEMFPVEKFLKDESSTTVIYNRGIGGFRIPELHEVLDICVLDLKPRRLFINIGTNDLSWSSITISQLISSYESLLDDVYKELPEIEVYVMAYFPVNYEAASEEMKPCLEIRNNGRIAEANRALEKMAEKYNARYIDINDGLKDEQGRLKAEYTIEGMHIKEEGYRAIFHDFMKYAEEPAWEISNGEN